jgi:UrcA family protein
MKPVKALLSLALCAASIAVVAPASAGERTIKIKVDDLDLARPSAQAKLEMRVANAVRSVCGSRDSRQLGEQADIKRCEAEATANAEAQMAERIAAYKVQRNLAKRGAFKVATD